jgi:hypothetical protein
MIYVVHPGNLFECREMSKRNAKTQLTQKAPNNRVRYRPHF